MVSRAVFCLIFSFLAAEGASQSSVSAASASDGASGTDEQAEAHRDHPYLPGVPSVPLQPGVRIFGPQGAIAPESRGFDPASRLDAQRPQPDKKPTDAEKAEALRKALAPKPSAAAIRQQTLDALFKRLAAAGDDETAKSLSVSIEHIWGHSESDTANLLMERGAAALSAGDYPLALSLFDKLVALKPQWAEAWNKRATTRFRADDIDGAMSDIGQTLKLEPRHYGALAGMGMILQKSNLNKQALDVFRKALALNPRQPELRQLIEQLTLEVEGRDI